MDQGEDPYQILGVANTATTAEIKKAYRKLALLHHPDKNKDDAKAASMFAKVANAYEILSDEEQRQQYDWRQRCAGTTKGFDSNTSYEQTPFTNNPTQTRWTSTKRTTTTNNPPPYYHTKTYYTTTQPSPPMHRTSHSYTSTTATSSPSSLFDEEPITVTLNGAIPPEMASQFQDPRELFQHMFAKEFGENPDFLNGSTPVRVVLQGVQSHQNAVHKSPQPQQQSMASSTRTVRHPDGSRETITETTITYSDGSTETKRQSSIQPSATTRTSFSRRNHGGTTIRTMMPNGGTATSTTGYRVVQTMS